MKPEAELAAGGDITVQDGLPSKPGHNNIPVKEESSAATANCSIFACELGTAIGGMLGTPASPTPPAKPPTDDLPTKLPVVSAA